jgi:hypothetical protein
MMRGAIDVHEEFLGEGYHNLVRSWLQVPKLLLPDSVIDSDVVMGGAHYMFGSEEIKPFLSGQITMDEKTDRLAQKALLHHLCAACCSALESRTRDTMKSYRRDWFAEAKRHDREATFLHIAIKA